MRQASRPVREHPCGGALWAISRLIRCYRFLRLLMCTIFYFPGVSTGTLQMVGKTLTTILFRESLSRLVCRRGYMKQILGHPQY